MQKCLKIQKSCMVFLQDDIIEEPTPILIVNVKYTSIAYVSTQCWNWLWEYAEIYFCIQGEATKYYQLGIYQHFVANKFGLEISLSSWNKQQNGSGTWIYVCPFSWNIFQNTLRSFQQIQNKYQDVPLMMKTIFLLRCNQGNTIPQPSSDAGKSHEAAVPTFRQILLHVMSFELRCWLFSDQLQEPNSQVSTLLHDHSVHACHTLVK